MIKQELGDGAIILHTRTVKKQGLMGIAAKPTVEITATNNTKEELVRMAKEAKRQQATSQPKPMKAATSVTQTTTKDERRNVSEVEGDLGLYSPRSVRTKQIPNPEPENPHRQPSTNTGRVPGPNRREHPQSDVNEELRSIRSVLASLVAANRERSARQTAEIAFSRSDDVVAKHYLKLIESEVAEDIAHEVIQRAVATVPSTQRHNLELIHRAVREQLVSLVPTASNVDSHIRRQHRASRVLAFVGPTGVGKTTTIAKLAATLTLREKQRVGLVTIDTYRIAAVDQLRTYADIIGVPLIVAQTPSDVRDACERLSSCDVIIIDTAGRAPQDTGKIEELGAMLDAAQPDEIHLVLSATASQSALSYAADCRAAASGSDRLYQTR